MVYAVALTDLAEADLEEIGLYIAQDNPNRALSFVAELRKSCFELDRLAEVYPVLFLDQGRAVRRRVFGRYLIFYHIRDNDVIVARIMHGSRDYSQLNISTN